MRSRAWGSLVGDVFPNAVRLSIHPQPCGSTKLGMNLLASQEDNWITPWHSTAVEVNGQFKLMKRETARSLGAQIATVDGKPSHYVLHDAPAVRGDVSELAVPRR
jgi:pyoverdine/dityrosine biosynthesis protein Dit1